MILTTMLCASIIFFILIRVPNQYETDFSRNLLQSVSGNSTSPKNVRKQFNCFVKQNETVLKQIKMYLKTQ